jgi:geranylgeranyl diphosphate synthase type I
MYSKKEKLNLIFNKIAELIEPKIKELLNFYVNERNQDIIKYQVFTGGKRMRPALAIISCRMLGGKLKDVLYPGAALEILHNYGLIIDDIIDRGLLRRGEPSTWAKFGKSITQCIGVNFAATIFQATNRSKKPVLISELFAKTMKRIADGEILDLLFKQKRREDEPFIIKNRAQTVTEQAYFKMIGKKTAFLIQTCCEVGGICANANKEQIQALKNYGFNLGITFQIKDDMLDIFGEENTFGKKIGKDILERKGGNIIILFALKEFSNQDKERFLEIIKKDKITDEDIKIAIKLIRKTKAQDRAFLLGKKHIEKAKRNLEVLPKNQWKNILNEIANFSIERDV